MFSKKNAELREFLAGVMIAVTFLFPLPAAAKDHKPKSGNIYDKQHKEVGHWRENKSTNETIIYDDLYREKYRINTDSGRVFDKQHREVGEMGKEF